MLRIEMRAVDWPMAEPFAIARGVQDSQPTLHLTLTDRLGHAGRGEACGIPYLGETPESMAAAIEAVASRLTDSVTPHDLLDLLPAGGARNAVDSALWDKAAKASGRSAFAIAGQVPRSVTTAYTIGIRGIDGYAAAARDRASYAVLKVKVDGRDPLAAIEAVRANAPAARLIVDPNQSWTVAQLQALAPAMARLGVALIEQPIPVGTEPGLDGWTSPVPLCADELIGTAQDLPRARGRFAYVNIKLDKSGGLTAALALADAAEAGGLGLMVGCMAGSSLSMAPAMILAQRCAFVDLDGPLLQSQDIANGFTYANGVVESPCKPELWG